MRGYKFITLLLVLILMFSGCTESNPTKKSAEYSTDIVDEIDVDTLLASMTLEEKAGQMVQGCRNVVVGKNVKELGLGSVFAEEALFLKE